MTLHGWYPLEVFHLPLRTRRQAASKYASGAQRGLRFVSDESRLEAAADPLVVADEELERGLAEGILTQDTRLRDALREIAGVDELPPHPSFRTPAEGGAPLRFERPSIVDDALFAVEAAVVTQADDVRLRRQVDELERRIQTLESSIGPRLAQRARNLLRR